MSDLVEFLRARLDEDEQVAREAMDQLDGVWTHVKTKGGSDKVIDSLGYSLTEFGDVDSQPWWTNPHIARHDPARVLREVEVRRALIVLYQEATAAIGKGPVAVMAAAVTRRDALHRAIAALTAAWSDHPDYREEWRP